MNDPMAISEAINNTVNNYLWTRAVIGWINLGISLATVSLITTLLIGGSYLLWRKLPKSPE